MKKMIAVCMIVLTLFLCLPYDEFRAEAVTYKELERFENQRVQVKATSDYYFDKVRLGSSSYVATCIAKDTVIGNAYYTVVTSQTTTSNSSTYLGKTNYGKTWGDSVNVGITMIPKSSISCKQYIASNYSMNDAKVWGAGSSFIYYVGSEDLYNYVQFPAPNTSYGYLSNWSPNYNEDTSGFDSATFGLSISKSGASLSMGTSLKITDDFVDGYDYSSQSSGLYKVRYDYKKYNSIGFCSSGRKTKIFGSTTVYDSLEYRAVKSSLGMSKYVYVKPTFTVCDSKTWPTEIKGFSGSGSVRISF